MKFSKINMFVKQYICRKICLLKNVYEKYLVCEIDRLANNLLVKKVCMEKPMLSVGIRNERRGG